jgi:hypothetical protein
MGPARSGNQRQRGTGRRQAVGGGSVTSERRVSLITHWRRPGRAGRHGHGQAAAAVGDWWEMRAPITPIQQYTG